MITLLYFIGIGLGFVGWLGCVLAAFGVSALWGLFMFLIPVGTPVFYARARQAAKPWLILQLAAMAFMVPHYAVEPLNGRGPEALSDIEPDNPEESEQMMLGELTDAQIRMLQLGDQMGSQGRATLAKSERQLAVAWHGLLMQRTRLFELLPANQQVNHQEELAAYQLLLNHLEDLSPADAPAPPPETAED